jgi:hypothetical protein
MIRNISFDKIYNFTHSKVTSEFKKLEFVAPMKNWRQVLPCHFTRHADARGNAYAPFIFIAFYGKLI